MSIIQLLIHYPALVWFPLSFQQIIRQIRLIKPQLLLLTLLMDNKIIFLNKSMGKLRLNNKYVGKE